jgi:hypothetical protein
LILALLTMFCATPAPPPPNTYFSVNLQVSNQSPLNILFTKFHHSPLLLHSPVLRETLCSIRVSPLPSGMPLCLYFSIFRSISEPPTISFLSFISFLPSFPLHIPPPTRIPPLPNPCLLIFSFIPLPFPIFFSIPPPLSLLLFKRPSRLSSPFISFTYISFLAPP